MPGSLERELSTYGLVLIISLDLLQLHMSYERALVTDDYANETLIESIAHFKVI